MAAECEACYGSVNGCNVTEEAERTIPRLLANLSQAQQAKLEEIFAGRKVPTITSARCFLDLAGVLNAGQVELQTAVAQPNPGADE